MIAGYCGGSAALDEAIARFALAYAKQTEQDHATLDKGAPRRPHHGGRGKGRLAGRLPPIRLQFVDRVTQPGAPLRV